MTEAKSEAKKVPEIPKKTKAAPDVPKKEVAEKPKKEKVVKPVKTGTKYTLLKNFDPAGAEKMPLQCRQILTIIDEAPGKAITKVDLLEKMKTAVITRQPIERILAFYQPRIISGKYVAMEAITSVVAPA